MIQYPFSGTISGIRIYLSASFRAYFTVYPLPSIQAVKVFLKLSNNLKRG
jgi:hypothetical protein